MVWLVIFRDSGYKTASVMTETTQCCRISVYPFNFLSFPGSITEPNHDNENSNHGEVNKNSVFNVDN